MSAGIMHGVQTYLAPTLSTPSLLAEILPRRGDWERENAGIENATRFGKWHWKTRDTKWRTGKRDNVYYGKPKCTYVCKRRMCV